jgi:hypothetical protein
MIPPPTGSAAIDFQFDGGALDWTQLSAFTRTNKTIEQKISCNPKLTRFCETHPKMNQLIQQIFRSFFEATIEFLVQVEVVDNNNYDKISHQLPP